MKGLQEIGYLEDVDVLSAVSGGSYAAAWLYAHATSQDTLSSDAQIQRLANEADLLNINLELIGRVWGDIFHSLFLLPFQLIASVFGHEGYLTGHGFAQYYEDGIKRIFLLGDDGKDLDLHITELEEVGRANKLPLLIIGATIYNKDDYVNWPYSKRLFEFTLLRIGSDGIGYFSVSDIPKKKAAGAYVLESGHIDIGTGGVPGWMTLARMARISGSALYGKNAVKISNIPGAFVIGLVEVDLGYKMQYAAQTYAYLIDGGFTDNLGAYPLIRRLCDQIVISDAEFDPKYEFESYGKLKIALRKDMQASFRIGAIDKVVGYHEDCLESGQDCDQESMFDPAYPIMLGRVGSFPISKADGSVTNHTTELVYIKMALDGKEWDKDSMQHEQDRLALKYTPTIVNWYRAHKEDFPHLDTRHQSFEPEQFRAYVDLGYKTVCNSASAFAQSETTTQRLCQVSSPLSAPPISH